jgi:glycosyltransferase involved in cell wall biosynthesis
MKIGIVSATYRPSRNGVATSTALLVRGLRGLGHEVRVFVPGHPEAEPEPGVYRLPSTLFGAPRDYPVLLPLPPQMSARLPLGDLDIIHAMHPFVAGRTALLWARRLHRPLVFTAHTQYHSYVHYAPTPAGLTRWAIKGHVRLFAQRADLVLAPGRAMVETLRGYGYHGAVSVIPNPVDLAAFGALEAGRVRRAHGVPAGAPLLVYVGRLAPEKNLPALLAAFGQVQAARPDCRLLLVGDGPSRAALEAQAKGLPVLFAGAVGYEEVPHYLGAADLFVTASTSEVLPMTFLESLAAGTPLAVAASPAAADLVEPGVNGLCGAADPASLAGTVLAALEPGRLEGLRRGARASAARFEVNRVSAALAAHYGRLVEERLAVA